MLHELLLSLSGHPSPLLQREAETTSDSVILSPSERALLKTIAHLSDVHCKLIDFTDSIPLKHTSSICQAVATSIKSKHLAKFRARILEVERSILRKDAGIVGAYNVVPLTAIVDAFSGWIRMMEWLLRVCEFMQQCRTGAQIVNYLCGAIQTGYADLEEIARDLTQVAETAWLKQVSSWLLYGRLPTFGTDEFFIKQDNFSEVVRYEIYKDLLPDFVDEKTAFSILFVGKTLNQLRDKGITSRTTSMMIPAHLRMLASLSYPIDGPALSSTIDALRFSLSRNALRELLPMSKIEEILQVLQQFFLLGRGEFAVALVNEASERARSKWRRIDHSAYERSGKFNDVLIKEGEVKAVLTRTWTNLSLSRSADEDEDEQLELARSLIQLVVSKSLSTPRPSKASKIVSTPFSNLLLSVPCTLTLRIPSPVDLFLTTADVHIYSHINAYLLAIQRAHMQLADLWKITSLRRSHPAFPSPPHGSPASGRAFIEKKRARENSRSATLRSIWATSSAALFLLGELEAYLQGEVIQETWRGFQEWLTGRPRSATSSRSATRPGTGNSTVSAPVNGIVRTIGDTTTGEGEDQSRHHDPETLGKAHRTCLHALTRSLMLTTQSYTDALYSLLQQIDILVACVHRIQSIWLSLDLESDDGVVDAFLDLHKEDKNVQVQLHEVSAAVKRAIEVVVESLGGLERDKDGADGLSSDELSIASSFEKRDYVPRQIGRIDRLLMKLDFGAWFESGRRTDRYEHDSVDGQSDDEFAV